MSDSPNTQAAPASASESAIQRQLADAESRITELETRTAFQDDLLSALNDVIAKQDRTLANLSRRLELLQEQLQQHGGSGGGGESTAHEPPPHY